MTNAAKSSSFGSSKYDMKPVDFTAVEERRTAAFVGVSSRKGKVSDNSNSTPTHLSRFNDSASWDEGESEITLLNWSGAKERLTLLNKTLDAYLKDATNECSIELDGEQCSVKVENVMRVIINDGIDEGESVGLMETLLKSAGPEAAKAAEAWCWKQAGTANEPRARVLAHTCASFDLTKKSKRESEQFVSNAVSVYLRDVKEECPAFHGADKSCSETVDAALLMTVCSYADLKEALSVVDQICDAGGEAAAVAVKAWCVSNPGAKHVDRIVAHLEDGTVA